MTTDLIVVGVDNSPGARAALSWAAQYAARTHSHLRVVHAYELQLGWVDETSAQVPRWEAAARERAEQLLDHLANETIDSSQHAAEAVSALIFGVRKT